MQSIASWGRLWLSTLNLRRNWIQVMRRRVRKGRVRKILIMLKPRGMMVKRRTRIFLILRPWRVMRSWIWEMIRWLRPSIRLVGRNRIYGLTNWWRCNQLRQRHIVVGVVVVLRKSCQMANRMRGLTLLVMWSCDFTIFIFVMCLLMLEYYGSLYGRVLGVDDVC